MTVRFVNNINKLLLLTLLTNSFLNSVSQNIRSNYLTGNINIDSKQLELLFVFTNENDKYSAGLYIPEQLQYNLKSSSVSIDGDSLKIKYNSLRLEVFGKIDNDDFNGVFKQGTISSPVSWKFISEKDAEYINRPQTPVPPYPYIEKDIKIITAKSKLEIAGTLTLPDEQGKYPLAILISGSGAQNRNEEIAGHKPFLVIADYLTKNGIAVFRYDDRGVGGSNGNLANSTTKELSKDVAEIVDYFKKYPNINKEKIGLIGHSEGGIISFMVAAEKPKDIAFIVSLAGFGLSAKEILIQQAHDINVASGMDENLVKIFDSIQSEVLEIAIKEKKIADMRKNLVQLYDKYGQYFSEEEKQTYKINDTGINLIMLQLSYPWMKYFITIKPEAYLKKIKCSVLALNGAKDIQVSADANLRAIRIALEKGKCQHYEIRKIENANHLFQKADNGTVEEYLKIQQTIDEDVLVYIKNFIKTKT